MPEMEINIMKVLIFTTRQLCYNSGYYFAHRIGEEIEKLGIECEYCEIPENAIPSAGTQIAQPAIENAGKSVDEEAEKMLESYIGKEYLAILDFNSKLPRLILDDESYYLDSIDAPFYNFILDHPLYHHSTLDCKLKNYYAFSIDENHCKYIQNFYPHIKAVYQFALGAENVISLENLQEKKKSILIMGTYRNPDIYMKQIYNMNKYAEKNMLVMLEKLENDNEMTVENALKCIINNSNIEKDSFPLILNKYYLVEMYYRNYYRKKMVDALVNTGFHIDIAGEWWESYDKINSPNVIWNKAVRFDKSYELIAGYRAMADSSPFFKGGVHDRVYAGIANYTAVMTDYNDYRNRCLQDIVQMYGQECNYEEICQKTDMMMNNDTFYKEMTQKAYEEYMNNYTWKSVAKRIIKHFLSE